MNCIKYKGREYKTGDNIIFKIDNVIVIRREEDTKTENKESTGERKTLLIPQNEETYENLRITKIIEFHE